MASLFIILGGAAAATSRDKSPDGTPGDYAFKYFTYGNGLFWWLVFLTAAVVGLFIHVKSLTDYFNKLPQQSASATVT
jgi:hypothetical protein